MMRNFFPPPPPPFFWHSRKKDPTDDGRGHDALNFLSSRQAIEDVATFVKAMNAKYSLTRTNHEHSEKGSIFFFAKREHFIFQPFKFQEKHLPTFNFQGIFVSSQGLLFAVGSTRNLWITWGGSYPGMLAGWLGGLGRVGR